MILGHEAQITMLKLLVRRGSLGHGYLFTGPRMVGKSTVARGFAHFLEAREFEPKELLQDGMVISPENDSISIDAVRTLKYFLSQKPNISGYRTAIIDHAELLTPEAQNALLKITEEPPSNSLIILVAHDSELLLPTLCSRLTEIPFHLVPEEKIKEWLEKEHGISKANAAVVAKKALGAPGRALAWERDEQFQALQKEAARFFVVSSVERKDYIKAVIEEDTFSFERFLDALILELTLHDPKNTRVLWHAVLELRRRLERTNPNPRLQLEALMTQL